jgi:hypothetical protein
MNSPCAWGIHQALLSQRRTIAGGTDKTFLS